MRILITNDDGINAPGLAVLEEIATDLAGDDGEVWVVAPAFEQSGVGHCISYTHPFMLSELAPRRFAAEGSPADCVLAGLHRVLRDTPPDLVLSGVNRGNNAAENTLYSGTIGGAMEAALQGYPALALSQFWGPGNRELSDPFEAARAHGANVVRKLLPTLGDATADYRLFYNINFPAMSASDTRGARAAWQGWRRETTMAVEPHNAPSGREFLWIKGGPQDRPTEPGSDVHANLDGWISVTPMRADLTAYDALDAAAGALAAS